MDTVEIPIHEVKCGDVIVRRERWDGGHGIARLMPSNYATTRRRVLQSFRSSPRYWHLLLAGGGSVWYQNHAVVTVNYPRLTIG